MTRTYVVWYEVEGRRVERVVEQAVVPKGRAQHDKRLVTAVAEAARHGRHGYVLRAA